jgi:hypothetical protein
MIQEADLYKAASAKKHSRVSMTQYMHVVQYCSIERGQELSGKCPGNSLPRGFPIPSRETNSPMGK